MTQPRLSDEIRVAYDWIDSAGEFSAALANPEQYARAAARNWREHGTDGDTIDEIEITEHSLLAAIELERTERANPNRTSRPGR